MRESLVKYKNKLVVLSALIAVLAILYIFGMLFEPARRDSRLALYSWMDVRMAERIDRIIIQSGDTLILSLINNKWYVSYNNNFYPARQMRVTDFIGLFTRRDSYPVRSNSPSSHGRFGLTEASASQIVFSGGIGPPLLRLLIGLGDALGNNVYMRKLEQNEVRSGEDRFTAYIMADRSSWYNLRLVQESEDYGFEINSVQRLTVFQSQNAPGSPSQIFIRSGRGWSMAGVNSAELDMGRIDSYVRSIINAEADDFEYDISSDDPRINDSRIVIEFGNGDIRSLSFSFPDENTPLLAAVSGFDFVFYLPDRMFYELFRDDAYFMGDPYSVTR